MNWRIGIAAPVLMFAIGCATAGPAFSPTGNAAPARTTIESISGRYRLVAIDGHALAPASAKSDDKSGSEWQVVGGTLTLGKDGTFHIATSYNVSSEGNKQNSLEFSGSCFANEGAFQMLWDGGGQTDFKVRGDTIVLNRDGKQFSYLP